MPARYTQDEVDDFNEVAGEGIPTLRSYLFYKKIMKANGIWKKHE
jgi:hypothetical protein